MNPCPSPNPDRRRRRARQGAAALSPWLSTSNILSIRSQASRFATSFLARLIRPLSSRMVLVFCLAGVASDPPYFRR